MPRDTVEKCEILRPVVKKRLINGLNSLEFAFGAARESLERGDEEEFLKNLSQARSLINDLSSYSMTVIVEDCVVWCKREDRADIIIRGISAML